MSLVNLVYALAGGEVVKPSGDILKSFEKQQLDDVVMIDDDPSFAHNDIQLKEPSNS